MIPRSWEELVNQFYRSFIVDNRWRFFVDGLANTLILTFFSLLLGVVLGLIVAAIRSSWDMTSPRMRMGPFKLLFGFFNGLCKVYLTVIRGTPVMVQLFILFFIIMAGSRNKMLVGIIGFGVNSGAYVAEIMRGGIMSVDQGQSEAGRSLGFNYIFTMWFIVLPQAFKTVLPSLANEFIVLLKETAIAGAVGVTELTRSANLVRGLTFQNLFPLLAITLIYLSMVMFFTWLVGKLERRLRSSER